MEEEMSKELAPLLGLMLTRKITTRTLIKREFGIDYKTIAKLVAGRWRKACSYCYYS